MTSDPRPTTGTSTSTGAGTTGTTVAITIVGQDRPGIIAEATAALGGLGVNLEDSTMTLLRGHFAMMLVCRGDVDVPQVERALAPLGADGSLEVTVRAVPTETVAVPASASYVLTVHGGDRVGIVSAVLARVAEVGGNVTDLTTRLSGELYLLVAEVDLPDGPGAPDGAGADVLAAALAETGAELGVAASLRPVESDDL